MDYHQDSALNGKIRQKQGCGWNFLPPFAFGLAFKSVFNSESSSQRIDSSSGHDDKIIKANDFRECFQGNKNSSYAFGWIGSFGLSDGEESSERGVRVVECAWQDGHLFLML